jgi:hypothetical protein
LSQADPAAIGAAVRQVLGDSLGYLNAAALRVAVRFNVADQLSDGPKTPAELAEHSGANAEHLHRVLRYLATRNVFREDETGAFHLTTASSLLRSDSPISMRQVIMLLTDDVYWRPAGKLDDTVANGTTAFPDIFGKPLFEYLVDDEERGKLFHTGLDSLSSTEHGGVAAKYDFPETGTVVDVAGGLGGLLHAVLTRNPGLHGILFDQESVVRDHQTDPALDGRWETMPGDFFASVPAGGDIYLLKRILHDWNDADSVRILRSCRAAMSDNGRVLIIDTVIPPGNDPHPSKLSDLAMMIVFDGKERTEDELAELLAAADLKLNRVIPTSGSLSIVEAIVS